MINRCRNTGISRCLQFLSTARSQQLRQAVDSVLDRQIEEWYANAPYAAHFESPKVHREYYRRNLAEAAWRIRLLCVVESKALSEIAKISPEAAKIWARYQHEEMLHDEMFIKDLEKAGVSRKQFVLTEPYLSTKLLAGFCSYLLDHEGPLGIVAYAYLVEYANIQIEPKRIKMMRETIGESEIAGQIAHANADCHNDHPGEIWNVMRYLIKDEQDITSMYRYFEEHQRIITMYFQEIYDDIVARSQEYLGLVAH